MDVLPPNHIRLLAIEPGTNSPIHCRLLTTSLDEARPYEALSYTWGSTTQDCAINCDGKVLNVTQNLYDALNRLRKPDQERLMWIDRVCIVQSDQKERSEQVSIMRLIFSKAVRVIVWLGDETAGVERAFNLLGMFGENFKKLDGLSGSDAFKGLPSLYDPQWIALADLFQRPYFSRVWVIQEIAVRGFAGNRAHSLTRQAARDITVCCGSFSCEWDVVANVAQCLRSIARVGPYDAANVAGIFATFIMNLFKGAQRSPDTKWSLLGILRVTRRFKATDLRDKVFAVIGIASDPSNVGIAVDYGLTAETVFTQVAVHQLETGKDLEALANAGAAQNVTVPSWVADWSRNVTRTSIAGVLNAARMSAAGDSLPILSISEDRTILTVRGAIVDGVAKLNKIPMPYKFDISSEASFRETMSRGKAALFGSVAFAEAAYCFPAGQTRNEALWRTLCCDRTNDVPVCRAPAEWAVGWKMVLRQYELATEEGELDRDALEAEFERDYTAEDVVHFAGIARSITSEGSERTLCVTNDGRLGYVPQESLVGDHICILFGSRAPFVMRESGHGRYRLIGECYLHGIMDGEAMKDRDIESLSRDFEVE